MFDSKFLDKYLIGWDRLSDTIQKTIPSYPPFNLVKKSDTEYTIEMAVAGFSKADLDIELAGDKLIIKGNSEPSENSFLYRGLAMRPFTHEFKINENIEITNASLINGILKIALEYMLPEEQKPTKIHIDGADND